MLASALVFALTGTAYGLYSDVTSGITTTDVIAGGTGGEQNILLVGVDSRRDAKGDPLPPEILRELRAGNDDVLNTDTIILLHLPEDGGPGVAFSIPRDSYVSIPDHGPDKINAAYPAAKARAARELVEAGEVDRAGIEAEAARQGRSALIRTVENLTGLTVDHYAEVNLVGFYDLTRAIGGVEVCLNRAVDEPLSGAHFPAGRQTISGGDALSFVRQRHGLRQGDLSRITRQQVFLSAVLQKVLSTGTLSDPERLAGLVDVAEQSLVIDEGWDVLEFARRAADLAGGNLDFVTIPTRGHETNDRGDVVLVDSHQVRGFVEETLDELAAAAEAAEAVAAEGPRPTQWVVDVRNGSTVPGIASLVSDRMEALGHAGGEVGNTQLTITSQVRWSGPDDTGAKAVAAQLGDMPVEHDRGVPDGHVEVVLGSDFSRSVLAAPLPPKPAAAQTPVRPVGDGGPDSVPCVD